MKYIIEIKPEYEGTTKGIIVLGIKNNCLCVDELAIEELEELNADYINNHFPDIRKKVDEAYQRGINDGSLDVKQRVEGAYQRGFDDGKDSVMLPCDGCKWDTEEGDGAHCKRCSRNCLDNYEEKQKAEAEDEIKVGDEVIYNGTTKCVVVAPETDEKYASLLDCNGIHYFADHRECKKTGRHFNIVKILEGIKHD